MASANQNLVPFPKRPIRRNNYELAFLPAALEIAETPPSPVGRAVGGTIIAIFCVALAWATIGKVDIVVTANGKIIPSGRTKLIQPLEAGVVRAILVHDGQQVRAGDSLIELDPTMTTAERDHVKGDLVAAQLDVARLQAALSEGDDPLAAFHPPEGATAVQIEMHRQFLVSQASEQRSKMFELDRQTSQKQAERSTMQANITKLEATIPLLQEQVDVRKYLFDKALGTKLTYLSEQQDLVGQQQDVLIQQSKMKEVDAALAVVVPQDSHLEIEATLSNDDVGFVHAGQEAEIKVHTFNFTRYGLLHGRVLSVSPDSITPDGGDAHSHVQNASDKDPQQQQQDLVYAVRVSLDQRQMQDGDKMVDLGPGMAVTAEVKTGSRRIIGYLLSPLARYQHDVLRER